MAAYQFPDGTIICGIDDLETASRAAWESRRQLDKLWPDRKERTVKEGVKEDMILVRYSENSPHGHKNAYIRFSTREEAMKWMNLNQSSMTFYEVLSAAVVKVKESVVKSYTFE